MVVNGELLVQEKVRVRGIPDNLNLFLGTYGSNIEYPGQTTDLNIFSSALPVEQMKSQTREGNAKCGLEGDFLSWEKSVKGEHWILHSKARWIDLDGDLE